VKYLLDTDTCVFWLKVNERIEQEFQGQEFQGQHT